MPEVDGLGRHDDWSGVRAVVAGFGVSGFAAADNLIHIGAQVRALTDTANAEELEKAELLEVLGGRIDIHPGATSNAARGRRRRSSPRPGFRPDAPLLAAARDRGIPVWGEVELAWRLRDPAHAAPWLARHRHQRQDHHRADAARRSSPPPACAVPRSATSAAR